MDDALRKQILAEAIRIGDEILSRAEHDTHGMFWKTMSVDKSYNLLWSHSENIYSGVSGICMFYIELYKLTKSEKYLDAATAGIRWVDQHCQINPTHYFAFYTGRMGVSFAMIKMYELLNESSYLDKALRIAEPCESFLKEFHFDDLLNGTAGTILGLLHLHAATEEKGILEKLNLFVEHLIENAHHGPVGLYWDRSHNNIRGLCGFSHGAAGIGYVFLELGHYFQNDAFYWIAEQAFAYENHWYDGKTGNWPDFRKGIWQSGDNEKFQKAYLENDKNFFTQTGDMNAWCHGAAGIGLARLRGYQLLQKYSEDVDKALQKTTLTNVNSDNPHMTFTLCHGGGGNADLFLQAFQLQKQNQYLNLAERVAEKALLFRKEKGAYLSGLSAAGWQEDTSLFMGNAGVAYFYLRVLEPLKVPSVLSHSLNSTCVGKTEYSNLILSDTEVKRKLANKLFPRTIKAAKALIPQATAKFFCDNVSGHSDNIKNDFIDFIGDTVFSRNTKEKCVLDVFKLELEKVKMADAVESCAYLHIKEQIHSQKIQLTDLNELSPDTGIVLDPLVRIVNTDWNWSLLNKESWCDNMNEEPGFYPILLKPLAHGIFEKDMSALSYTVLSAFQNEKTIQAGVQDSLDSLEEQVQGLNGVKQIVYEQIKEALACGILLRLK